MSDFNIYFNPQCSKCRIALQALNERGEEPEIIKYLESPPSREELSQIIDMLAGPVSDLVRKDRHFEELGLDEDQYCDKESVLRLLEKHPRLMQRPVVVRNGRAVIARTPESIEDVLES